MHCDARLHRPARGWQCGRGELYALAWERTPRSLVHVMRIRTYPAPGRTSACDPASMRRCDGDTDASGGSCGARYWLTWNPPLVLTAERSRLPFMTSSYGTPWTYSFLRPTMVLAPSILSIVISTWSPL